jgi:hypothetical protein
VNSSLSVWNRFFDDLLQRGTWAQAVKVQRVVIRNALGSIACAWAANACFSLGNPFSLKASWNQSKEDLIVANVVWCGLLHSTNILLAHVPTMMTQRFIGLSGRRPGVTYCILKIVRGTSTSIILTLAFMIGGGILLARLSRLDGISKFKPEFYFTIMCNHLMNTGVMLATRQIYFQETQEGQDRLIQRLQMRKFSDATMRGTSTARVAPTATDAKPKYVAPNFCRAYVTGGLICLPIVLAGGYVQLLSQLRITQQGSTALACFVAISMLTKMALQETAKHFVMRKRIRSIRVMSMVVGVPTVVIDTQARIILLGMNSAGMSAVGTFGMAILEISVRVAKAYCIMRRINRRQKALPATLQLAVKQHHDSGSRSSTTHSAKSSRTRTTSTLSKQMSFMRWREQCQTYHTAELNADMYAEYIAIGCSASILFFYGDHPLYSRLRLADDTLSAAEVAIRKASRLNMLLLQIAVEVVVDYASIVLEVTAGVNFDQIKDAGSFLAAVFGTAAVDSIIISVIMYLD